MVAVGDRDPRVLQIAKGASNVARGHVIPRVAVEKDDQDTFMATICGENDEIVKVFEVTSVPRQDSPSVADGVGQMDLITAAGKPDVCGDLGIVPVTAQ
jgi:hypothetical protein